MSENSMWNVNLLANEISFCFLSSELHIQVYYTIIFLSSVCFLRQKVDFFVKCTEIIDTVQNY